MIEIDEKLSVKFELKLEDSIWNFGFVSGRFLFDVERRISIGAR